MRAPLTVHLHIDNKAGAHCRKRHNADNAHDHPPALQHTDSVCSRSLQLPLGYKSVHKQKGDDRCDKQHICDKPNCSPEQIHTPGSSSYGSPALDIPSVQHIHEYAEADDCAREAKPSVFEPLLEHAQNAQTKKTKYKKNKDDSQYK